MGYGFNKFTSLVMERARSNGIGHKDSLLYPRITYPRNAGANRAQKPLAFGPFFYLSNTVR